MKAIMRQTAIVVLLFSALYSSMFAISVFMVSDSKNINVMLHSKIYKVDDTGMAVFCFDSCRLQKSRKPKLVTLGSSNVMMSFNPDVLQHLFPEYEVANLGTTAANISDIRQAFELLHMLLSREVFNKSVFVIGMWYDIFNRGVIGRNDINESLLATGLYQREGCKIRPVVPAKYMYTLVRTLRPLYFCKYNLNYYDSKILTNIRKYLADLVANLNKQNDITLIGFNWLEYAGHTSRKGYLTKEDKDWLLEIYLNERKGEDLKLGNKGFEELLRLCQDAKEWGGTIVLVDMPLPKWHMDKSAFFKDYQIRKISYIHKAIQLGNVHYLSLQYGDGLTDEANFNDATHPKDDNVSALWCQSLKERWNDALK